MYKKNVTVLENARTRYNSGRIVLIILLLATASLIVGKGVAQYSSLTVYVDPLSSNANVGGTFTISVKLTDGIGVFGVQVFLAWYPGDFAIVSYKEGDFLSQGINGTTRSVFSWSDASGYLKFWNERLGAKPSGVSGSGTLFTATFSVKGTVPTGLYLYDVRVLDELLQKIRVGSIKDGYVNVKPPMFHVAPSSIVDPTLKPGGAADHFTVNLTLTDVIDARGFAFALYYNSTLLNATKLTVVPFLKAPATVDTRVDNNQSFLWVNLSSSDPIGVTGNGSVANVTFQVLAVGQTPLKLNVTNLDDSLARLGSPPFQHRPPTEDGYFSNIPAGHDVKVSKITVSPTTLNVGETVKINATISNFGAFNETVYVAASYDPTSTVMETRLELKLYP